MKKMPLFYKVLISIIAFMILLAIVLLIVLWNFLSKYQAGLPIHRMDMIISELEESSITSFFEKYDFYIRDFEEDESIISYLEESFGANKELSYKKIYSRVDTRYGVLNGDDPIFTLVLHKEGNEYELDYILLNTEISVQIDIPKGFSLYFDDKKVGEKWIVERHNEDNIDFPSLFVMEGREKEIETYSINGLLKEVEVRVFDYDGKEVPLALNEKLEIDYRSYDFSIPAGLTLLINDKEVASKYIIKEENHPDFDQVILKTYRVGGFLGDLSYKAYDTNGEELEFEEEDNLIVLKKIEYKIDIPAGSTLYIDGIKIDKSEISQDNLEIDLLELVPDKYAKKPTYDRYTFDFLGGPPDIRVESSTGFDLKVDKGKEHARARFNIAEDEAQKYFEIVKEMSFMYSKYVTNDISRYNLMKAVKTDTPIYEIFRELQPYFYTDHIGYEFKDVKVGNIQKYADNLISGDTSYVQYIYKSEKETFTFPSSFTFFLLEYEGEWYFMDFIVRESVDL